MDPLTLAIKKKLNVSRVRLKEYKRSEDVFLSVETNKFLSTILRGDLKNSFFAFRDSSQA